MKKEAGSLKDEEQTLASPGGTPFGFEVTIKGAKATDNNSPCSFEVMGPDPETGAVNRRVYHLPNREHNAYLDLFESLAQDFGLNLPRNRQPSPEPTFKASYRALLTENLAPGILYGYGDPAVLRVEDGVAGEGGPWYYLVSTSNDAPDSFPIIRSRDLLAWEFVSFVFPRGRKPEWAADGEFVSDYWAPEIHKIGDEFRVYFVARDKQSHELSIGMASSASPGGPFSPKAEPIIGGGVIDPHVFVEDDQTAYLYWKEDTNDVWPSRLNQLLHAHPQFIAELFPLLKDQRTASFVQTLWPWVQIVEPMERFFIQQPLIEAVTSAYSTFRERLKGLLDKQNDPRSQDDIYNILQTMRTLLYAQMLSPDGSGLVGGRTKIIENDQGWEAHLVEGEWVTKQGDKYYLFYAGNDFSTAQYGIGVAIADSPLGPYRKMGAPFLSSTAEWAGPGHPSVAVGPDGVPYLFLHAFFPGRKGYKEFRALLAAPIKFEEDRVLLRRLATEGA